MSNWSPSVGLRIKALGQFQGHMSHNIHCVPNWYGNLVSNPHFPHANLVSVPNVIPFATPAKRRPGRPCSLQALPADPHGKSMRSSLINAPQTGSDGKRVTCYVGKPPRYSRAVLENRRVMVPNLEPGAEKKQIASARNRTESHAVVRLLHSFLGWKCKATGI